MVAMLLSNVKRAETAIHTRPDRDTVCTGVPARAVWVRMWFGGARLPSANHAAIAGGAFGEWLPAVGEAGARSALRAWHGRLLREWCEAHG